MPLRRRELGHIAAAALMFFVGACADDQASVTAANAPSSVAGTPGTPNIAAIAAGTALPAGYKVDTDRTMIFGTDEKWTGRLTYTTSTSADEVFDFLHREMPNFGWTEASAMRSDVSLLTFISASTGRMATVNISRGSALGSTRVDMVVAPQNSAKR